MNATYSSRIQLLGRLQDKLPTLAPPRRACQISPQLVHLTHSRGYSLVPPSAMRAHLVGPYPPLC